MKIKLEKKDLYVLTVIIILFAGTGIVIALNSGDPQLHGHSADEVEGGGIEKFIKIERYPVSVLGSGTINYNTQYPVAQWEAAMVGFDAGRGEIARFGSRLLIKIQMVDVNGNWHIQAAYGTTSADRADWSIDVMFINRSVVQ
jgi:hypothetical protein